MKMHDLGITNDEMYPTPVNTLETKGEDKKKHYPSLTLRNEQVKVVSKECEVGDEYETTVRVRIVGKRNDEYGRSVDFHITQMANLRPSGDSKKVEEFTDEDYDE